MSASIEARIAEHVAAPIPPTSPSYDQALLGHRAAMIRIRDDILKEDMPLQRRFILTAPLPGCDVAESSAVVAARPPRGQYDFVDTVEAGQGLIRSPGHDTWTIARVADRAEDVGYIRALQASEHRMMTSIKEVDLRVSYQAQVRRREREDFYTQLHDARTDRRDIRLEIDVVRGQRTAYKTELHDNHACNKTRSKRCHDTPESLQAMIDRAIQRNSTHTQDDASQSSGGGLRRPMQPARVWTLKKKLTDKYCPKGEIKKLEIELWNLRVRGNDVAAYTQRFQELALMCTKFLDDETKKVDKYISVLPDNIHRNVMSARPKTLDDAIKLANDLMDQKLCTYAERQNDNKRMADDSSRNNQQPHKNQKVSRAYTAGPGEKKAYTGNLPLCTKCNYHHNGQCAPKCGNCKRYGHTTNDCWVDTNNNNNNNHNKNQKAGACYECGNTGHIKKNFPKLKNHRNVNGNGTAQGRAYALGGRDASPDSNVITDLPEVFPKDLPGIPPARQVEFQIDLVIGVAPVAQAPSRLAPSEMKELAEQLQELSDKGFIRPISSP
ncbi:putative reverse transcriptase domain-containing protein [Tanacetum coccineum]